MFTKKSKKALSPTKIVYALDHICDCLNNLYSINSGGCCYIAYCIATILEKEDIPFRVVVNGGSYADVDDFSELDDSCYHIFIQVGNDTINADGLEDDEDCNYSYTATSSQILNYYKNGDWNDVYEKALNSSIKSIITRMYNLYKLKST